MQGPAAIAQARVPEDLAAEQVCCWAPESAVLQEHAALCTAAHSLLASLQAWMIQAAATMGRAAGQSPPLPPRMWRHAKSSGSGQNSRLVGELPTHSKLGAVEDPGLTGMTQVDDSRVCGDN